jgi:hypothetical protein
VDCTAHIEEQFSWLVTMAQTKGWESYAWRRAKELAASDPMYLDFPERLTEAMTSNPASTSSTESGAAD